LINRQGAATFAARQVVQARAPRTTGGFAGGLWRHECDERDGKKSKDERRLDVRGGFGLDIHFINRGFFDGDQKRRRAEKEAGDDLCKRRKGGIGRIARGGGWEGRRRDDGGEEGAAPAKRSLRQ